MFYSFSFIIALFFRGSPRHFPASSDIFAFARVADCQFTAPPLWACEVMHHQSSLRPAIQFHLQEERPALCGKCIFYVAKWKLVHITGSASKVRVQGGLKVAGAGGLDTCWLPLSLSRGDVSRTRHTHTCVIFKAIPVHSASPSVKHLRSRTRVGTCNFFFVTHPLIFSLALLQTLAAAHDHSVCITAASDLRCSIFEVKMGENVISTGLPRPR